ncbi:MAG: CRTAC1 family protein [Ardenticatenaceae bacterium]
MSLKSLFRRYATHLVALLAIVTLFGFSRLPTLSTGERESLAADFAFSEHRLPELSEYPAKLVREVHPSMTQVSGWISAAGASVALNDLDGDGLSNDVCQVEPRIDQVIVAPAPTTAARYEPFVLNPAPLGYDAQVTAPSGCLPGDFNEDGLMDLLVYYFGRTPILFLSDEDVASSGQPLNQDRYVARELLLDGELWNTTAATVADLDGDGHLDLIIGNYFQDSAEVLNPNGSGTEQMHHSFSRAYNGGKNRIFLWTEGTSGAEPTVRFTEVEGVLDDQMAHAWTLAIGAADLDGDQLPELYFANDLGPDRLLHNQSEPGHLHFTLLNGEKYLTTPNSKVLGRDSFKGMGIDFGDLNGDGLLDMYVSNIAAEYALQESHFVYVSTGETERMAEGVAPYVDHSEPLGMSRSDWGWETRFGDFNNDGVLEALQATGFVRGDVDRWPELQEIAMANDEVTSNPGVWPRVQPGDDLSGYEHNPFFVRSASGRYFDLAAEVGLDQPFVTRGMATADVDGDGDLDLAVANQWEPSYFYLNETPSSDAFLGLHLRLPVDAQNLTQMDIQPGHPTANERSRPAIGAAATVELPDGRRLVAQVDGGNGHSGARSPDLHFGLGDLSPDSPLPVTLQWRDGQGNVHKETVALSAGWHTVTLAGTTEGGNLQTRK